MKMRATPTLFLYYSYTRIPTLGTVCDTLYFIFSISVLSHPISRLVYTFSVISVMTCPTIYLIAYSSTPYFFACVIKCIRPS